MKTAVTNIKTIIKDLSSHGADFEWLLKIIDAELETEKKQIIEAFNTCCNCEGTLHNAEDYYKDTFENN